MTHDTPFDSLPEMSPPRSTDARSVLDSNSETSTLSHEALISGPPGCTRVVVVGGGFGGMSAAKRLGNVENVHVTIIDKRNHYLFQPLLYQVAMSGLDPSDVAAPIRSILSKYRNINTLLATVAGIDYDQGRILCDAGSIPFDYAIIACGAMHDYFGNDKWENHAPGLKTIPQATEIRRRVLLAFENAERTADPKLQSEYLTFVVVGGGPTGVELAGAIAQMAHTTLRSDYRTVDAAQAKVLLVQSGDRILKAFDEELSRYAIKALGELGVTVRLGDRVTDIQEHGVLIGDEFVRAKTVIWAAGVRASALGKKLGETDRVGRVIVDSDLSIPDHPNAFVVGDMASAEDESGKPYPGLAPVAMQQGRYVAELIIAEVSGKSDPHKRERFHYFDKGHMATIGRHRAVAETGRFKLKGMIAWLGWLFIHIMYLNGFRRKFFVFLSWMISYFTYSRGARLIVRKSWQLDRPEEELKPANES
ncbi:MAG: NAD(P)/FAD-dependent oxidoreductase [Planctomycetota bacterium]